MWSTNQKSTSQVLPHPSEHRGVNSPKHMEVSAKNVSCRSSEPGLNASVDPSSSALLPSGSETLGIEQLTPLCRQLIARRSILPALKPKIVPVKPVKKQNFTDGHLKPRGVSSPTPQMKVSVKDFSYPPCESDLTSVDPSSSLLAHSGSPAVRMDTHMPHRQQSIAALSNLPVLESKYVQVKSVNQQNFTDGPPKQVKMSVKNISYPACLSDWNDSVDEMKMKEDMPYVKANRVLVKPVNRQKSIDGPPKCSTSNTQMKVSVKDIFYPTCESGLNARVDRPSSLLPLSGVPVKPVNKQSFTNGPPERRGVSSAEHKMEVSVKNISFPLCEFELNAGVDRSSSLLPPSGSPAVRVNKHTPLRQHHVAAPTCLPVLKPSFGPLKPIDEQNKAARSFFLTETEKTSMTCHRSPEYRGMKFPKNLIELSVQNGTVPSCGSDLKVKSHLSLPRLPGFTSGLLKMNKRESVRVSVFTNMTALKLTHVPVVL